MPNLLSYLRGAYGEHTGIIVPHNWEWALRTVPIILDWVVMVQLVRHFYYSYLARVFKNLIICWLKSEGKLFSSATTTSKSQTTEQNNKRSPQSNWKSLYKIAIRRIFPSAYSRLKIYRICATLQYMPCNSYARHYNICHVIKISFSYIIIHILYNVLCKCYSYTNTQTSTNVSYKCISSVI